MFWWREWGTTTPFVFVSKIDVGRCEALTALLVNIQVSWDVTPCNLVHKYRRFWKKMFFPSFEEFGKRGKLRHRSYEAPSKSCELWIQWTKYHVPAAMDLEQNIYLKTLKLGNYPASKNIDRPQHHSLGSNLIVIAKNKVQGMFNN
jgi:hypothetical protein